MGQPKSIDTTNSGERSSGSESRETRWILERHYPARRRHGGYRPRYSSCAIVKQLFDPFFFGYIAVWLTVHCFRYLHYPLPFVNGWLTDFIFIPAVAHFARTCVRYIFPGHHFIYPLHWLIVAAIYTGVMCEWLLPKYTQHTVGDVLDAFAYVGGALFFYYVHQKNARSEIVTNTNFNDTYPKLI